MNDRLFCQIPRPKIGIRVVVDGRCNGVREKIEAPTFALAQKAKELLDPQNSSFSAWFPGFCFLCLVSHV